MVIGGFTDPQGARDGFGALLLGVYDEDKLRYAGKVGTGFDDATLRQAARRVSASSGRTSAAVRQSAARIRSEGRALGQAAAGRRNRIHRVERRRRAAPSVIPGVARGQEGHRRRPRGTGGRQGERRRRRAGTTSAQGGGENGATRDAGSDTDDAQGCGEIRAKQGAVAAPPADTVAGIKLSRIPTSRTFPEADLAKRDLARYYDAMAERALPYLRDRPLALVRCPDGWRGQCFYQKHADASVNAAVTRVEVPEGNGTATYFGVPNRRRRWLRSSNGA